MKFSSSLLEKAVIAFSRLPGIGRKTALRTVLHLIQRDSDATDQIIQSLQNLKDGIKSCSECYNLSDEEICQICSDKARKHDVLCIVESVRDVMAIEETGQYRGLYHVLGGVISPIDGIGPADLNVQALIDRVDDGGAKELIMAVSPTIEGETTIFYISKLLKDKNIKVSVIARGISFGGELEYADELTLGRSIATRTPYIFEDD
jgi:recombination protein RecR